MKSVEALTRRLILRLSSAKGPFVFLRSLAWHLGLPLVAEDLARGTKEGVQRYYGSRVTDCNFLLDPNHYEHPRVEWVLKNVKGGIALEVGCGNGGMTQLLSQRVDRIVALDVSGPSIEVLKKLRLTNVEPVVGLVEDYRPVCAFDWIILSEVVEHLRDPLMVIQRCLNWCKPTGKVLLTTPNGRWESIEHLHEFDMVSWCNLLARTGAKNINVFVIRDGKEQERWLGAVLSA